MSNHEKKARKAENLTKIIDLAKSADDSQIELETLWAYAIQAGYELGRQAGAKEKTSAKESA